MSTARPPADDLAIQLAIDEGLEVAETTLQTRMQLAEDEDARDHALAALSVLRKRQCDDGGGR